MDLDLSADKVRLLLENALNVSVTIREGALHADLGGGEVAHGPRVEDVEATIEALRGYQIEGEATIYTPRALEVLVREETAFIGPSWARRVSSWPLELQDPDQGLIYTLGPPSEVFALFLVHRVTTLAPDDRFFWRRRGMRRTSPAGQASLLETDQEPREYTLIDALQDAMPRLYTLRITGERDASLRQIQQWANAFSFQLAYNLDTAFVSVRSLEEVLRRTRLRRLRRVRPQELDPPRRLYGSDLVYHYQMGVATDSIPLEFLSYYHVAEHFFESVFEEDLIVGIKEVLTQPGFSFRRKQDIRGLVRLIKDRLRLQHEDMVFSEQEALRLVLKKYVDMPNVLRQLDALEGALIGHYAEEVVSFANGDTVNLRDEDRDAVVATLSRRIYKTRNAVVHSKEGGKPRYMPFRHDRELAQELPLMRLMAEEILINSATVPT